MSNSRPSSSGSRPNGNAWPEPDDGPATDEASNGSAGSFDDGSEDGAAGDVNAGGDGGVEPSGEER